MLRVTPYTIAAAVRPDKINAKGLVPIVVYLAMEGKRKDISTGLRVKPEQWEAGRVKGHPNAALYNAQIGKKLTQLEAIMLKAEPRTMLEARQAIEQGEGGGDFIAYATRILDVLDIAPNTRRRWTFDLQHIKNYAPTLRFAHITPQWLTLYNRHLLSLTWDDGSRRMVQNSAIKAFVFIRRIFNEALADGTTKLYPFADWSLPAETRKDMEYLTVKETEKIRKLLDDRPDLDRNMRSTIAHFLLECYSGIRHSDWGRWTVETIDKRESLKVITAKTGAPIYIQIDNSPRLKEIINYIQANNLGYAYTNQDANKVLKTVGLMVEIDKKLTTHVGRHTAGTLMLEMGYTKEAVAENLGISMKVVDRYAKMTRQKVRNEYDKLGGL